MNRLDDPLSERVIECIIAVHRTLGPGFLESIYRRAMVIELRKHGLRASGEVHVVVLYDGHRIGRHRLDLIVEECLIVELKTVRALNGAHYAQVRSYLKAAGLKTALLVNFAGERADIRRVHVR